MCVSKCEVSEQVCVCVCDMINSRMTILFSESLSTHVCARLQNSS